MAIQTITFELQIFFFGGKENLTVSVRTLLQAQSISQYQG